MAKKTEKSSNDNLSFDFLSDLDLSNINWEKEIKYVGALAGSVTGSFVSTQLSWSLGLRIATVVGASYSGAILATIGYQVLQKLAED